MDELVVRPTTELTREDDLDRAFGELFSRRRDQLLRLLRQMPSVLDIAQKLTEGKTYRAVIAPELRKRLKLGAAEWDHRRNGLLAPTIREVGGRRTIVGQVSLQEVSPEFLASVNQLAVQNALGDIVNRLEIIDEKLDRLLEGQHDDRLAMVNSGVQTYKQAAQIGDPTFRKYLLANSVGQLNQGRESLVLAMERQLACDRTSRSGLAQLQHLVWPDRRASARSVHSTFQVVLRASYVLAVAFDATDERAALVTSLRPLEDLVQRRGTEAAELARSLPFDPSSPPEELWTTGMALLHDRGGNTEHILTRVDEQLIEVEFRADELLAGGGV